MNETKTTSEKYVAATYNQPELSDWKCYMFGMEDGFVLHPIKDKVPNRFWRWMQFMCFGNRWVKDSD